MASSGITYHGKILKPDGSTPVTSSTTQFRIQVRTPGVENCLLWEEQQTKDLSSSEGVFTITIADSTEPTLIANTLPYALEQIFSNRTPYVGLTGCSVGNSYTPSSSADGRSLQVYFRELPTDPWEQMPTTKINFVPLALNSVQLEGYGAKEFLKIDPLSSYTPLTSANVTTLMDIIAGTNNQYLRPSSTFSGDVSGTYNTMSVDKVKGIAVIGAPTAGQILKFDGTNWAPAADNTGGSPADASYTVKGIVQINTDLATSGLFIAGGVLALPNVITAGGPVGTAQTVPVITYDQKGRLTAVSTATIDDTTKLPLAGGTMTGNINMGTHDITNATNIAATNASVRNVVLNDNDANTITLRAPADVTPSNYNLTLPATAGTNGYVLSTDGSGNLSWINPSGGSVTSISSANNYLSVATPTTTPVLTVNVGTVANTVAAGDDARITGALQTATYDADVLPAASCTTSQTAYWNSIAGTWACQNINAAATGAFVDGGNTFAATATLGTNSNHNLEIETNGTTKMVVQAGGSVGVGTINPSSLFEVRADNSNPTISVRNGYSSTSRNPGILIQNHIDAASGGYPIVTLANARGNLTASTALNSADTMGQINFSGQTGSGFAVGASAGSVATEAWSATARGSRLDFATTANGTATAPITRMSVDQSGNVGIGTTTPAYPLEVTGNMHANALVVGSNLLSITQNGFQLQFNEHLYVPSAYSTGFGMAPTTNNQVSIQGSTADSTKAALVVQNSTPASLLYVRNDGNIGVGTASPATRLDIAGGVRIGTEASACAAGLSGTIRYNGGAVEYCNGTSWLAFGVSGAGLTSLNAQTGSTQTFASGASGSAPAISSAANVHTLNVPLASGAGVTSGTISKTDYDAFTAKLTSPLTTKGDILAFSTVDARLPAGTNGQVLQADSTQTTGLKWATPTAGTVTSVTSANSYLSVATTTTTPVITANVGTTANTLAAGDDPRIAGAFVNGGNTVAATATLGTNSNHNLEIETNGTTKMTVTNGGNVGIGTTSPLLKLDIVDGEMGVRSGTMKPRMGIWAQNADSFQGEFNFQASRTNGTATPNSLDTLGAITFGNYNNQSAAVYGVASENHSSTASGGFLAFHTTPNTTISTVERMRIDQNGNVGIGSTIPDAKLVVRNSGTGNVNLGLKTNDGSGLSLLFGPSNVYKGAISYQSYQNDMMEFRTGGVLQANTRMVIDANGKVGIGILDPVMKLDVTGGVKIGAEATACAAGIAGTIRYNGGAVEYCNGTSWLAFGVSGAGLTSLGGQVGSTQTFAAGTSGTAPAISSAANVHTLNVPLASGAGVTSGTISKTDYDAFTAKLTSPLTTKGDILAFSTVNARLPAGTNGQVLQADSTQTTGLKWATPTAGTVTSVTSANSYLTVATTTTTPVITAVVGTAANTLAAGDDARITGALQTSVYDADVLPAASCTTSQTPYWNGVAGTWACQNINFAGAGAFVDGGNTFAATATLGTNSNHNLEIETNGTTKMTVLANGNVGIGTNNPSDKLVVYEPGAGNANIVLKTSTDTAMTLGFSPNNVDRGTITYNSTSADMMEFRTGGVLVANTRLAITGTGNVGIGTTAPNTALDVNGAISNRGIAAPALSPAGQGRMYFDSTSNTYKVSQNGSAYSNLVTSVSGSGGFIQDGNSFGAAATLGTNDNFALNFETNGATKMTVLPSGNVGIGTTSPGSTLDVRSANYPVAHIQRDKVGAGGNLYGGADLELTNTTPTANNGIGFYFKAPNNAGTGTWSGIFGGRLSTITGGSEIGDIVLTAAYHGADPSTAPEHLVIRSTSAATGNVLVPNGNLGIGLTSPNTSLDVSGAISNRGMAAPALSPAGQGRIYFDSTANKFKVSQNGGAYTDLVGAGGGNSFVQDGNSFAGDATLGTNDNYALNFETNGTNKMTVQADGKVLIGTGTASTMLDVKGDISAGSGAGRATISAFGTGMWIDLPTTGASGIGSGGPGSNAWIGYSAAAGNWFSGSAIGDVNYRNASGKKINIGIDDGSGTSLPTLTVGPAMIGMGGGGISNWNSTNHGIQMSGGSVYSSFADITNVTLGANMYDTGAGVRKYIGAGSSTMYSQNNGGHGFYVAAPGTAGNTITYTEALDIASTGNITTTNNLEVGGQVLSTVVNNAASTTFNFDNGNMQYTSASCGAMTLQNMRDGGTYTLAVQGTTQGTCTFTHGGDTFLFSPANGPTVSGTDTTYHFTKMGSKIYVTWVAGYQ